MWKAVVLEVLWVPSKVVSPSEVDKSVPPLELILVCWEYYDPEKFHYESMVVVVVRV